MSLGFQIVTVALAAVCMAAAAPRLARAGEMGVIVPPGGTYTFGTHKGGQGDWAGHRSGGHESRGHKSGVRVFGKTGGDGAGTFVAPRGKDFGHGGKPFVHKGGKVHKNSGKHRKHAHRKLRGHRFPVIVYPLGGSYAVTTGPYDEIYDDEPAAEEIYEDAADDDVFAITNSTDQTMTVYDNGEPVCVLAPGVRCSFDVSKGRHDVSIGLGESEVRRVVPRASGAGKMIVVWEALEKLE